MDISKIRNFSIIAHIDHGKSTLADRLLEFTKTIDKREMMDQIMDSMDLERERGITIKLNNARLKYNAQDGKEYILNLIDTPGHVDFTYEVSRSLSACEGVLLIVDAVQGIEAQTLANAYLAINLGLKIIPVINKIDLPAANVARIQEQLIDTFGIEPDECIPASAKNGIGIEDILEAIVKRIPAPSIGGQQPRALIFDSYFDDYRGIVAQIRVKDGTFKKGMRAKMMSTGKTYDVTELGIKTPFMKPVTELTSGEVGYLIASIKNIKDAHPGDTITDTTNAATEPLLGYRPIKPMVFCGLYPVDGSDYKNLKEALEKIQLSDAALAFEVETSQALGFGFRCGFLGLLHMEIIQERLEREHNLNIIATAPSVVFEIIKTNGEKILVDNPARLPDPSLIAEFKEPIVKADIIAPKQYSGIIMELCQERRGQFLNMEFLDETRAHLHYHLPMVEILTDFYNKLKSISQGYASFDYEVKEFVSADMVKLDILLNGELVDALSSIVHRDNAFYHGRKLCEKLKELIPRQMFEIPIQAAIGAKVVARENIRAMRKDVTAKCYGGDVTRKRKLLEKQKEGKKRMKSVGSVEIPQEAFLAVLKIEE